MCKYNIIAITGIKRSGKDVVANYIEQKFGYKHVKISSKLKEVVKIAFDLKDADVESSAKDDMHERLGIPPRRILDFIGTHVFQYEINRILPNIGRKFWISDLLMKHDDTPIVISDLRFHHELEEIRKNDSVLVIKINRNQQIDPTYISESEINELQYDVEVINDKLLEDLFQIIDELLNH